MSANLGIPATVPHDAHSVARSAFISLVGAVAAAVLGFALTVVVARGLGASSSGVIFVGIAAFTITSTVARLGADTGLVRAVPRLRAHSRASDLRRTLLIATVPVFVVGLFCAVVGYLEAQPLAEILLNGQQTDSAAQFIRTAAPFLAIAP